MRPTKQAEINRLNDLLAAEKQTVVDLTNKLMLERERREAAEAELKKSRDVDERTNLLLEKTWRRDYNALAEYAGQLRVASFLAKSVLYHRPAGEADPNETVKKAFQAIRDTDTSVTVRVHLRTIEKLIHEATERSVSINAILQTALDLQGPALRTTDVSPWAMAVFASGVQMAASGILGWMGYPEDVRETKPGGE